MHELALERAFSNDCVAIGVDSSPEASSSSSSSSSEKYRVRLVLFQLRRLPAHPDSPRPEWCDVELVTDLMELARDFFTLAMALGWLEELASVEAESGGCMLGWNESDVGER